MPNLRGRGGKSDKNKRKEEKRSAKEVLFRKPSPESGPRVENHFQKWSLFRWGKAQPLPRQACTPLGPARPEETLNPQRLKPALGLRIWGCQVIGGCLGLGGGGGGTLNPEAGSNSQRSSLNPKPASRFHRSTRTRIPTTQTQTLPPAAQPQLPQVYTRNTDWSPAVASTSSRGGLVLALLAQGLIETLHSTPYTLHSTPCTHTPHPTPHTPLPTPHTPHPTPHTKHPTPYTLHPEP